jgi:hypothetical protein
MDAIEYKRICSRPDAFPRNQLEATAQILSRKHPPSAQLAGQILRQAPIAKPELHTREERTDCFLVEIDVAEAEQIMEYLIDAEAEAVGLEGQTTQETSHIANLVGAWVRYIHFRDGAEV